MATYIIGAYSLSDFVLTGGATPVVGSQVRLSEGWSASTDAYTLTVTDDDTTFSGNVAGQTDTNQTAVLTDDAGGTVASGDVRLAYAGTAVDPNGGTITFYQLYVDGTYHGMVASKPIQPGVTYEFTSVADTTGVDYAALATSTYEQSANNTIDGGQYDDNLASGSGNDTIKASAGDDIVSGGAGDDNLDGGTGNDTLSGGDGSDTFKVDEADEGTTIIGGEGGTDNDSLFLSNYVTAGGVNLTFSGNEAGSFSFVNGTGTGSFTEIETIGATNGADSIDGSATSTGIRVFSYGGNDTVRGGSGNDLIDSSDGNDTVFAGDGNDVVYLGQGDDSFGDWLTEGGNDTVYAGLGADWMNGGYGDDVLYGEEGSDAMTGGAGSDTLYGGDDDDDFYITDDHELTDVVGGEGGNDWDEVYFANYTSLEGVQLTYTGNETGTYQYLGTTGAGNFSEIESFDGTDFDDTLDAAVADWGVYLDGWGGDDVIIGGSGSDILAGSDGADTITGGAGSDNLWGGSGGDTFVVTNNGGNDWIEDFDTTIVDGKTVDQLDVSQLLDINGDPVNFEDIVVGDDGSGNALLSFSNGESILLVGVDPASLSTPQSLIAMGVPCFVKGTLIATPYGERAVEDLKAGDLVTTLDSGSQPVLWVGSRQLDRADLARRPDLRPVIIAAGAMGQARALEISPQHALAAMIAGQECLVRARHLAELGLARFHQAKGRSQVAYHHLLLPRHALVMANGIWAESLYPGPIALKGLSPTALMSLLSAMPEIGEVLTGGKTALQVYGPSARPVLARRNLLSAAGPVGPLGGPIKARRSIRRQTSAATCAGLAAA